jgi:hypothetical protein
MEISRIEEMKNNENKNKEREELDELVKNLVV